MFDKSLITRAVKNFIDKYPAGFEDKYFEAIRKKHNIPKVMAIAAKSFEKEKLSRAATIPIDFKPDLLRFISAYSMISTFEKIALRNYINSDTFNASEFAAALYELLYGDLKSGFLDVASLLHEGKCDKWPVITSFLTFVRPNDEVFVKPTTVKGVLSYLKLTDVKYNTKLDYNFYVEYRAIVKEIAKNAEALKCENLIELQGFLYMLVSGEL